MKTAVVAKFVQNNSLKQKLLATGDRKLVETTRDTFWGAGATMYSPCLVNNNWNGHQTSDRSHVKYDIVNTNCYSNILFFT